MRKIFITKNYSLCMFPSPSLYIPTLHFVQLELLCFRSHRRILDLERWTLEKIKTIFHYFCFIFYNFLLKRDFKSIILWNMVCCESQYSFKANQSGFFGKDKSTRKFSLPTLHHLSPTLFESTWRENLLVYDKWLSKHTLISFRLTLNKTDTTIIFWYYKINTYFLTSDS